MLNRRIFLKQIGMAAFAASLAGCSNQEQILKIFLLQGSIPAQSIKQFQQKNSSSSLLKFSSESQKEESTPPSLKFLPESQLKNLFEQLLKWEDGEKKPNSFLSFLPRLNQSSVSPAKLVTLGDKWLNSAIKKNLLQPLNEQQLTQWPELPQRWQYLVKRNAQGKLDKTGQVWGAPYRWGTTLIAYRRDKEEQFGGKLTDWGDLWREQLRNRLSVVDEPREIIGLVLKQFGYSYNTEDTTVIESIEPDLQRFQQQVRYYSSKYYLQPLVLGDTWVAVGWSNDIIPLMKRNPKIGAIIPQSGTSLWADLWVKPTSSLDLPLSQRWIDFCWQEDVVKQIGLFADASSPMLFNLSSDEIPETVRKNPLLYVDPDIFEQSEFILPLPEAVEEKYVSIWKQIRLQKD